MAMVSKNPISADGFGFMFCPTPYGGRGELHQYVFNDHTEINPISTPYQGISSIAVQSLHTDRCQNAY